MVVARTQTLVQLTDELVRALDERASRRGTSRSQVVREAVESYLHDDIEAEQIRRMIEGYRRHPQLEHDEWGDPLALAEQSTRETFRRLDEEEREAGLEPW